MAAVIYMTTEMTAIGRSNRDRPRSESSGDFSVCICLNNMVVKAEVR